MSGTITSPAARRPRTASGRADDGFTWLQHALLAVLALSACRAPDDPPRPAGSRSYDAIAYALTARFDWDRQVLLASEDITLALTTEATLVDLDSTVEVTRVDAGGRDLDYAVASGHLEVELAPVASGADPVTFTVEYQVKAATSNSLRPMAAFAEDPVRSRVVFTHSEPNRGHEWLVQKDDPSDPALFAVTLTVPADEDVVANGERLSDTVVPDGRRVAYALDVPIATYLMAFAAGELERVERSSKSGVPLALWYRRGLPVDPAITLDAVEGAMAVFEMLLGPYPFARYSVLLQPAGGLAMENATLTIESEDFGEDPFALPVHAHELAHHWFGNLVTMHGYDDVWVKEGMATLLSAEAGRARSDAEGRGRLLASYGAYNPGDAIVNPSLPGLAKYTTGPYYRGAALITQIRAKVGETVFWASLRQFLADHARGSATGEEFIRAFAPALSESDIQQVLATLPSVSVPKLEASLTPSAGGAWLARLTLSDPERVMIAPYEVTVVDPDGAVHTSTLTSAAALELTVPAGGYIAPDEGDVHIGFPVSRGLLQALSPVLLPAPATAAADLFSSRSASHQERALAFAGLPALLPGQFPAYYDALDSDRGTVRALIVACSRLAGLTATEREAWLDVLTPIFHAPRIAQPTVAWYSCGPELGATFLDELKSLAAGTDVTRLARLEYLMSFDFDAEGDAVLEQLASSAPTLRLRLVAKARLELEAHPDQAARLDTTAVDGKRYRLARAPSGEAER